MDIETGQIIKGPSVTINFPSGEKTTEVTFRQPAQSSKGIDIWFIVVAMPTWRFICSRIPSIQLVTRNPVRSTDFNMARRSDERFLSGKF